jgi:alkylation response protein AidB-like acyl-CoA dehydrogenase
MSAAVGEDLRQGIRRMVDERLRPRAAEIDERGEFPADVRRLFVEHDVFATIAPPEYGGLDGSLLTLTTVCEEIARGCANSGMLLGNQYLGAGPLLLFGTEEQKQAFLPRLASGEWLCSFALTEPDAGSDAGSLRTRARRDGDDWVISGRKCFITQANVADVLTVFARADEGITAFLVTREDPGWSVDKVEHKMGLRGSPTCSLVLDEVRVPGEAIVGVPGGGMRIALGTLDKGRIMTASLALGIAQGALDAALAYARGRHQFGRPIADFQAIQFMLADMETDIQAGRALVRSAAAAYDAAEPDIVKVSAATKLFATDMVNRVTSTAVQVLGGYGYIAEFGVERMMRDARVFSIFEGTNQIQRVVIARELVGRRA